MTRSAPAEPATGSATATATWNAWRGSPELLAQVVRAAQRSVAPVVGAPQHCRIVVEVAGDEEVFDSPSDLVADVTDPALRHFRSIDVEVGQEPLMATLLLRWRRPWWKPPPWGRTEIAAEVVLKVIGADKAAVEAACGRIACSVERGTRMSGLFLPLALGMLVGLFVASAAVSASYLLKLSSTVQSAVALLVGCTGLVAGAVWSTWLWPSLEVARPGQSNWRRALKFGGPVVLTLILSGITKKLYG